MRLCICRPFSTGSCELIEETFEGLQEGVNRNRLGEERGAATPRTHFVDSNANLVFEGKLYFPKDKVKVVSRIGGGPSPSPYTGLIAYKFRFSTNAALDLNSDFGGSGRGAVLVQ